MGWGANSFVVDCLLLWEPRLLTGVVDLLIVPRGFARINQGRGTDRGVEYCARMCGSHTASGWCKSTCRFPELVTFTPFAGLETWDAFLGLERYGGVSYCKL